MISQHGIREGLKQLGVCAGDRLIIHSSLKSFGDVIGGSLSVIKALLETVGQDGLVVMPTFSYSFCLEPNHPFNPLHSPSRTGTISEAFRKFPGVVRSLHPTHSFSAYGKGAMVLLKDHHRCAALGIGSPIHRLAESGGRVLLLGVDHTSNSILHTAETIAGVPYLDVIGREEMRWANVLNKNGTSDRVPLIETPGCSKGFGAIDKPLRTADLIKEGLIGNSLAKLMRGDDLITTGVSLMATNPGALLCDNCETCLKRKAVLVASPVS